MRFWQWQNFECVVNEINLYSQHVACAKRSTQGNERDLNVGLSVLINGRVISCVCVDNKDNHLQQAWRQRNMKGLKVNYITSKPRI